MGLERFRDEILDYPSKEWTGGIKNESKENV